MKILNFITKVALNKKYFCAGLLIKILLGSFLVSTVSTDLFFPFVNYFIESNFKNPYERFLTTSGVANFPYPVLMLYIVALPKILLGWIAPTNVFWNLFLFRLPLLLSDISIFFILKNWLKEKFYSRLIVFYWFSPVLIYISYIHGQLDVIPIALLFGSLFYLFKNKFLYTAVLLGCALAAKTHILLVYPFFFLFLLSKRLSIQNVFLFFVVVFGTFFLINLPYIFDTAFLQTVVFNPEQLRLFSTFIPLNNLTIYLIPAVLLALFVRGILLKNYNRDIFVMFLGFVFSTVLFFIVPMQGWYFWLIPFLVYFYIKEEGRSPIIFFTLSGLYLLYFMVIKDSDYFNVFQVLSTNISRNQNFYHYLSNFGLDANKVVNLVFTSLQTTLLINCFWIYKKGLENYSAHKIMSSPFLIGVGGNSSAGKTIISDALSRVFTLSNTLVLRGDDMHKWQRKNTNWDKFTHLDPKANYLYKEIDFLKKLKAGKKISRSCYDHNIGQFTSEQNLKPKNIIVFEGLHSFYLSSQRGLYDLKVFVKPATDLMYHWKIIRDKEKRGYSKSQIIELIKKREKDSKKYIDPQMKEADVIVESLPVKKIRNIGNKREKIKVYYKLLLSNAVYIEPIVEALKNIPSLNIMHQYTLDDYQTIILKGDCSNEKIAKIAQEYIEDLEELGVSMPVWPEGLFGVLLLLLVNYIFEKAAYDKK